MHGVTRTFCTCRLSICLRRLGSHDHICRAGSKSIRTKCSKSVLSMGAPTESTPKVSAVPTAGNSARLMVALPKQVSSGGVESEGWWWYINIKYINCCLLIWNICDTITIIVARGVCAKHGAKDACSVPGCSTNSQSKGLCGKHGANGSCTFPGCEVRNIYTTEYISTDGCSMHTLRLVYVLPAANDQPLCPSIRQPPPP